MVRAIQDELAEEVTEQYSDDQPVHETKSKEVGRTRIVTASP